MPKLSQTSTIPAQVSKEQQPVVSSLFKSVDHTHIASVSSQLTSVQRELYKSLLAVREEIFMEKSKDGIAKGVTPDHILQKIVLEQMAKIMPTTMDELIKMDQMGGCRIICLATLHLIGTMSYICMCIQYI